MSDVHSTSPSAGEPELGGLDERDQTFIAFLEGDLSEAKQREFRSQLAQDDELRREFEQFSDIMGGVQNLPFEFAPPDFVDKVRTRIRVRSKGRFFGENLLYSSRMPYEAIAVVMIAVMAAAWLLMGTPKDRHLQNADPDLQVPPRLETTDDE